VSHLGFSNSSDLANEGCSRYERASIRATLAADPDFRFCFSSACDSGQLHPGGASEPIFSCQACRHKHCVICETNWHDDQTCEEYQAALHRNTETDEQSQREVDKCSKPCPECRVPIQKNSGCDHMTCQQSFLLPHLSLTLTCTSGSRCRHQFCWVCAVAYSIILTQGNHHHEKSCSHYRPGPTPEEIERRRLRDEAAQREIDEHRRRREAAAAAARAARAVPPTPVPASTSSPAGSSTRTPARTAARATPVATATAASTPATASRTGR
jgi:hypothetical protein